METDLNIYTAHTDHPPSSAIEARHLHIRVGFGTQLDGSVRGTVDQLTPGIGHNPHTSPWKSPLATTIQTYTLTLVVKIH